MTSRLSSHFSVFGLVFFWELRDNFYSLMSGLQALGKIFLPNFHRSFRIKKFKKSWQKLATKNRETGKKNKKSKRNDLGIQKGNESTRKLGGEGIDSVEIA